LGGRSAGYASDAQKAWSGALALTPPAWWIGNGRPLPMSGKTALTVNEVILAYARHCQEYYRGPNGKPTQEPLGTASGRVQNLAGQRA
jgi:hypothetical protein